MPPAKKAAAKRPASTDSAAKDPAAKKPATAFSKAMTVSPELAAVIGGDARPRTEVTSAIWAYIKTHELQDPANKRNILADDKLKAVFGGKSTVTMFEMTALVSKHLS